MTREANMNLVLLGPPGAGKWTQAALLIKAFKLLHISTGDMLREMVKEGSDLGKEVQGYMNRGELVPDAIVTQCVVRRMTKPDASSGVMLDGYPRTIAQAESLEKSLSEKNVPLAMVLYFRTSEDVAVQRLSGRRVCPKCGKNYHVLNMPPKKNGICDSCDVELFQREDDKPGTVKNRLHVYQERTRDLIDYYKAKDLLREVDGDLPAEKLFDDISDLFRRKKLIADR